jgi:hypothetical protein
VEESFIVVDAGEARAPLVVCLREDFTPDGCDRPGPGIEPVAADVETKIFLVDCLRKARYIRIASDGFSIGGASGRT